MQIRKTDFSVNFHQFQKNLLLSGQYYVSLDILWYNFMILGLKRDILAPGHIDPPHVTREIPTRHVGKG